jgi:hypothetical protein
MRTAYVGLSTPLLYDYQFPASKTEADLASSPNPILDSPFGLMLLYDEIWFLCRSLCPENMRSLNYVRFLDEEQMLPDLSDIRISSLAEDIHKNPTTEDRYRKVRRLFESYDELIKALGLNWEIGPDNHTNSLQIGSIRASANSVSLESILFDHEVVKRLNNATVELIANSFGQFWLEESYPVIKEAALAQLLVIEDIPNYLTFEGPYHPSIDEARENPYLIDFRKWISSTASSTDPNELQEVKREVEEAIRKAQADLFLENLDPRTRYYSVAKTICSAVLDALIPGMSTAVSLVQDISDIRKKDAMRWQGFLVSLR